ncbi:hypothetical protein J7W19_07830 [Streptomyces mobaraensis NBRC 13819 = DSM 40847]|uniref:hypothetical protein n=1 Tax=Streptomyces mobaraensis TaxID=35621 RepID=UPI001319EEEF|nr:hypothetical protein [Streptomyces mobaraensis]QTT73336.1 hypothetical protein J7W19_07830 [Streptomyces mobaraensis NBRC 13819 = DSM 40847]
MYGKPALGTVVPLAGLTAAPKVMPGLPYAKGLQEAAGAGFLLYCSIAAVLLSLKFWYAIRNSGGRS